MTSFPSLPEPVLVTGCRGFLGAWTLATLASAGVAVIGASRDPDRPSALLDRLVGRPVERVALPTDADETARLLDARGIGLVLHLAGQSQVGAALADPPATLSANAVATAMLLEGVRRSRVRPSLVLASTDGVYGAGDGTPFTEDAPLACTTPYEVSKAAAEMVVRAYASTFDLGLAIARFGNIYGPGDTNRERIVPGTVARALSGERPVVRDGGRSERAYLYVEDAVAGLVAVASLAADPAARGAAFNVSGERAVTTLAMMSAILGSTGRTDLSPEIHARPPGEEISVKLSSPERLTARTGWRPAVGLEEGLRRTVAWEREGSAYSAFRKGAAGFPPRMRDKTKH